jgi:hypothetical protein
MMSTLFKAAISAVVIVAVAEVAGRFPRLGALLLTLPFVSILAFVVLWTKERDMTVIAQLARETLILVPLGLPFFIPFAVANRTGLPFWPSFALGILLATITIGLWFQFGPTSQSLTSEMDHPHGERTAEEKAHVRPTWSGHGRARSSPHTPTGKP